MPDKLRVADVRMRKARRAVEEVESFGGVADAVLAGALPAAVSRMSRNATSGRAPAIQLRARADHCGVERDCAARCPSLTGLCASASAAAAPLIGGGKLPFLALGLSSLAVLAPAPNRLGAASHWRRA